MIPLMTYIRGIIRDEQRRDWLYKGAWILVLLTLSGWVLYYNDRTYGGCTESSVSGSWLNKLKNEPCTTWFEDDPMMLSGFVTVLIGLSYSLLIDRNQIKLVRRLHDIAVINLDSRHWSEIRALLKKYTRRAYMLIPSAAVILTLYGFRSVIDAILSDHPRPQAWTAESVVASLFCAVLVGFRLGRAVANGFTGRAIRKVSPSFEMVPQHPDGAGGLGSIGRFYLWQAGGLLIPTVWLLIWIWLISYKPEMATMYEKYWLLYFQILLFVLLPIIWPAAVIVPMYSFHRLIVDWKEKHLGPTISDIRTEFRELCANRLQSSYQHQRTQELFNYLHSLTTLPDWPFLFRTLTVFGTVTVPFLAAALGSLLSSILE